MSFKSWSSVLMGAAVLTVSLAASSDNSIPIPSARCKFNRPDGWKRIDTDGWAIFKPGDEFSRLGFVTFSHPNESTKRVGQIATHFELKDIQWHGPHDTKVGD